MSYRTRAELMATFDERLLRAGFRTAMRARGMSRRPMPKTVEIVLPSTRASGRRRS